MKELMRLLEQKRKEAGIKEIEQTKSLEVKIQNKIKNLMDNSKYNPNQAPVGSTKSVIRVKLDNLTVVEGITHEENHQNNSLEFWKEYEAEKKLIQKNKDLPAFEKELKKIKGPGFNSQKFKILFETFYNFDIFERLEKTKQSIKYFFLNTLLYLPTLSLEYCGNDEDFLHLIKTEENRILII